MGTWISALFSTFPYGSWKNRVSACDKTAVIYARVSTVRQADEELPIASQIEQCKAKAESLGARVDRVFVDEGKSGRTDERQAFQDAINYCELAFPTYLVTWSTSRFSRNKLVSDHNIDELAQSLRYIIETTENPKKLRHFFGSFISAIWVSGDSVRIEYQPECLIDNKEPRIVPSNAIWLPEHALLGTRILAVSLPGRFQRKAA